MSKTIERIKKLLALANCDGAAENEAEVAGNLAAKLMEAAGLTLAGIDELTVDDEVGTVRSVSFKHGRTIDYSWQCYLAFAAGRVAGCGTYKNDKDETSTWVGSDRQRAIAQELFDYLVREVEKRTKVARFWREDNGYDDGLSYARSFRLGMVQAVSTKARQLVEASKPVVGSPGLVRQDALSKAIGALMPRLSRGKAKTARNSAGYTAGTNEGSSLELRKSVSANQPKRLKA